MRQIVVGQVNRLGAGVVNLDEFAADTAGRLDQIRQHAADRDAAALARCSHRVAGACLSMGAVRLGRLCRHLETLAGSGDRWQEIDAAVITLDPALADLRRAVGRLLADQRSIS
ncbi:MAG: Hpt domain-containing protein [Rhodospirillales bacterium]|nr:Hpt domain-containing protein [Rhodospirillales bacterium]